MKEKERRNVCRLIRLSTLAEWSSLSAWWMHSAIMCDILLCMKEGQLWWKVNESPFVAAFKWARDWWCCGGWGPQDNWEMWNLHGRGFQEFRESLDSSDRWKRLHDSKRHFKFLRKGLQLMSAPISQVTHNGHFTFEPQGSIQKFCAWIKVTSSADLTFQNVECENFLLF